VALTVRLAGLAVIAGFLPCSPGAAVITVPDEIIVTARKFEERLLTTPVAVTVFDADAISALNLGRLDDLARFTPGFSLDSATGRQASSYRPVIRGLTTVRNGIANASSAATFIDGIYVGGSPQATELYNVERVEILRGPQTALYGRNTYAGAINYVTRRPGAKPAGEVALTAAEHETYEATAWSSGPLAGGGLSYLLAAGHREYGGEYRNLRDGSMAGGEQAQDATGKLYWRPGGDFEATLKAGVQVTDDAHFATALQPSTLNNCCPRTADAPRARGYFVGRLRTPENVFLATDLLRAAGGAGTDVNRTLLSADLRWRSPSGIVVSGVLGRVADDIERGYDLSYAGYDAGAPARLGSFTQRDSLRQTDVSREVRLHGAPDGVRWTLGAYAYDGELRVRRNQRVYVDTLGALVVAPQFGPLSGDRISNFAVFGGLDADLAPRWTGSIELRWARDDITVTNRANDGTGAVQQRFDADFLSVAPRFTLAYAPEPGMAWYANAARGIKPGDFNTRVPDESLRAVDEETAWSYELGFRALGQDSADRIALAAYYTDVRDQQLTTLAELADGSTASITTNVNHSRVIGAELEAGAALGDSLTAAVTYGWTRATYLRHVSVEEADLRGSDGSLVDNNVLGDVSGNRLPRVPEHTASAQLRHDRDLGIGTAFAAADWSFESSRFVQEHNLAETGNAHLLGVRAGLESGRWITTLWVANLLDEDSAVDVQRYFDTRSGPLPAFPQLGPTPVSSSPRAFAIALPRGRQAGLTVRYRFGG
jgi:outer membrane receptor protein involved in Fe transport